MAAKDVNVKVGRFLSVIRKKKGLTQTSIAKKLGVLQSILSHWENGSAGFARDRVEAIADAYGMTKQEKREFQKAINLHITEDSSLEEEVGVLYKLIALPKELRQRIIQVAIAYDSVSYKKNGD